MADVGYGGSWPLVDMSGAVSTLSYEPLKLPFPPSRLGISQFELLSESEGKAYVEWVLDVWRSRADYFLDVLSWIGVPVDDLGHGQDVLVAVSEWLHAWVPRVYSLWRGGPWPVGRGGIPEGLFRPTGVPFGAVSEQAVQADAALMSLALDLTFLVVRTAQAQRPELHWELSAVPMAVRVPKGQKPPVIYTPVVAPNVHAIFPIVECERFLTRMLANPMLDPDHINFLGDPAVVQRITDAAARGFSANRLMPVWLCTALVEDRSLHGPGSPDWPRIPPRSLQTPPGPTAVAEQVANKAASSDVAKPENLLEAVKAYRQAGWFSDNAPAEFDAGLTARVRDRLVASWGSVEVAAEAPEGVPLLDWRLLELDTDRTWAEDIEADAEAGEDVYVGIVNALAARSGGAFQPANVRERWLSEAERPDNVEVNFEIDSQTHTLALTDSMGYLDPTVVTGINALLPADGPRFWFIDNGGQTALVTRATKQERDALHARRPVRLTADPPPWWTDAN